MKQNNNKELCLELVYAETEKEVISILKKYNLWDNPQAWNYFGERENNYGDIGNQQSKDGALVEKLINSVDAVLMAEDGIWKQKNKMYNSPSSIKEALEVFYNITEGKLSNISPRERTSLANNIALVASGSKSNPCYSIIDRGEGQSPIKMPRTLLSLGEFPLFKVNLTWVEQVFSDFVEHRIFN